MSEITAILGIVIGLLSVATFIGGTLAYVKSSSRKEYASERDIGHLKNSLNQMSQNVEQLWRQTDSRFDHLDLTLLEIKMEIGADINKKIQAAHDIGKKDGG
jgi:phosphoribosylaminoimidazole-succinocarboxamide synthase